MNIRTVGIPFVAALLTASVIQACQPDPTRPTTTPSIEFRTEAGYTFQSDTVTISDTLLVGVVIKRGTDAMNHFKVTRIYDNGPEVTTDSLPMGADDFEFDKTIFIREQTGTELWRFNVVENDGDVIRRSLTFTVVE